MSYLPVTVDANTPTPNPDVRSQGMDDQTAAAVLDISGAYEAVVMRLRITLDGNAATANVDNAKPGETVAITWGDGYMDFVKDPVDETGSATSTHTYRDGVYTATAQTSTDRASTEVAVNWPAPFPDDPQPVEGA